MQFPTQTETRPRWQTYFCHTKGVLGRVASRRDDELSETGHGDCGRESRGRLLLEHDHLANPSRHHQDDGTGGKGEDHERQDAHAQAGGRQDESAKLVLQLDGVRLGTHQNLQFKGQRDSTYLYSIT